MKRLLVVPAVLLAACLQGQGDRCETQDDCDTGLICVFPVTPLAQSGGICEASGIDGDIFFLTDQAVVPDLSVVDLTGDDLLSPP